MIFRKDQYIECKTLYCSNDCIIMYNLLTFDVSLGLISVLKNNAKKLMIPQKKSGIEPNDHGLDSTTLPSEVM